MKLQKLLLFFALGAMSVNALAAINSQAVIKITSDESGTADKVTLYQDPAATANYASNNDNSADNYNTVSNVVVNMWVVAGSANYSILNAPSLNNMVVKFKANMYETAYTMTFSDVSGEKIVLVTADNDTLIAHNDSVYAITCTASQELTFTINPSTPFYPREIASGNWGTFCYEEAISSVEGATVYEFKGKDATRVQVGTVTFPLTAGKAYLFNATADAQKFFYTDATKATQVTANNGLIGKFAEYTTTADDADAYVIKGTSLVPAAVGSTVPANRAYVQKLSDIEGTIIPGAPGRRIFNIVGTTTDLEAAEAAGMQDGKMMINGQLIIIKGGKMFNAQGAAL